MQNKVYSADDAGYMALSGGWRCGSCGCSNGCWDCCSNCGWNRCGVVRTASRQTNGRSGCKSCQTASARSSSCACEDCQEDCAVSRTVQCCPDNTCIRSTNGCGCNGSAYTGRTRSNGCNSDCDECSGYSTATTSRTRSYTCENDCDECNGYSTATTNRARNNGCDSDCDECNGYSTATTNRARNNGCDSDCDECNGYSTANTNRTRSYTCENDCDECNSYSTATTNRARSYTCENDCDECNSYSTANTSRTRNNGCENDCDECSDYGTATASRASSCTCEDDCDCDECSSCSTANTNSRNARVGMVYAAEQKLDQVYESESALRTGTLFPELHKPMNGYCPGDCNCATQEQEAAFAAWDLRLYLNTHPNDKRAQKLFRCLCEEADDPNYATAFLNEGCCDSDWDWTDDPWPWECRPCGK